MQDIPRNELLDKLAAGWTLRRKAWSGKAKLSVKGKECVYPKALIAHDWEGEPPKPVRNYQGLDIVTAFRHLKNGAAFVRRQAWLPEKNYSVVLSQHLTIADIIATDWEVWG